MKCRHCDAELSLPLVDLGSAPPSNNYLTEEALHKPETWYPLRVLVCTSCWLAQTEDFAGRDELFTAEYAYFSSFSRTWLDHAERYVTEMVDRFGLNDESHVVEVAANDGYLLQYIQEKKIPCTGIEPTRSTASVAKEKGLEIVEDFFGVKLAVKLAEQGKNADLIVANNVLAHVPEINDFVSGFAELLKPSGVATFEFPHLCNLVEQNQFDTIYHEHYSYLSFTAVKTIFEFNRLVVFDVEELSTHGGSLRVFAQRKDTGNYSATARVQSLLKKESRSGIISRSYYNDFQICTEKVKNDFLNFLIKARYQGKKVAAYGAAAKGNTLLNFAGIRPDLMAYVVDKNPAKQNTFMPGSRIPIKAEEHIISDKPDYVIILPWNIKEEVMAQLDYIRDWNGQFVCVVPMLDLA